MKKFERFTVTTCVEIYHEGDAETSALDTLIASILDGIDAEVTLIEVEYEGEYELVLKSQAEDEVTA
jgi:hypothetical protein